MTDQSVMLRTRAEALADDAAIDLRAEILAAAESVFAETGLYEARVEEITRSAGIAKGTFYLYFPSKEELIRAVARAMYRELSERCRAATAGRDSREDRIRALTRTHAEFLAERPDRLRVLHQVRGMMKFARPEWRGLRRALDEHLECVRGLIEGGAGASARFREAARFLFGSLSGCASVWAAAEASSADRYPAPPSAAIDAIAQATIALARAERRPSFAASRSGVARGRAR